MNKVIFMFFKIILTKIIITIFMNKDNFYILQNNTNKDYNINIYK